MTLRVKINDEDKTIILLCSLLGSYDQFVTTLTYEKDTLSLDVIIFTLMSHSQRRQSIEEGTLGYGLYVNEGKDCGRNKGKASSGKKRSKSKNRKTVEFYS